ncbi:MAG: hypothetical protein AB1742_06130 [bacterium]
MADRQFIELHKEHLEKTLSVLYPISDDMNEKEQAGTAAFVMNIYSGIENILRYIMEEDMGEKTRKNGMWHKVLLAKAVDRGIISAELGDLLLGYLKFRHHHVHGYSYLFKWDEFKHLAVNAGNTVERFFAELKERGYF